MKISDLLKRAWNEVIQAGLPAEIQSAAFREAVSILRAETTPDSSSPSEGAAAEKRAVSKKASGQTKAASAIEQHEGSSLTADAFLKRVSDETDVPVTKLERVFHVENGVPRLNVTARRLGDSLKERMEAVATLIPVARQAALDENETSASVVRAECCRLNCIDRNFSTYVAGLTGILYTGSSRAKVFRVRPQAAATFEATINRVLGEGSKSDGDEG